MASLLAAEELGGAEEAGAEEGFGDEFGIGGPHGGGFRYSGGGIGGARYEPNEYFNFSGGNALIGFERYYPDYRPGTEDDDWEFIDKEEANSTAFKSDKKPRGINWGNIYNANFVADKVGSGINSIVSIINDIYGNYRNAKRIGLRRTQNEKIRHRVGIVFRGVEDRDQLVRSNRMPAYYSTSNIKDLLRRGIMPFGWNSTMAIEQGFGHEIYVQEMKAVSDRKSKEFLRREKEKEKLKNSLGELENLRNRFKTRKILEYYNQY